MSKGYIKFWGVRGSNPTPDKDKVDFGGDTSCVEIRTVHNDLIILDMGSGIRNLGKELLKEKNSPKIINIFLSHFHFDHIMGFLIFPPLFNDSYTINIHGYNKHTSTKDFTNKIMDSTFWPVGLDILKAKINFIDLDGEPFKINQTSSLTYKHHPHPGTATSYKLNVDGKTILYTTDCEHPNHKFNQNVLDLAINSDFLIHDSHFTPEDLATHKGWGHSSWKTTVDLAKAANINQAILYHFNPLYSDKELLKIESQAQNIFENTIAAKQGLKINF